MPKERISLQNIDILGDTDFEEFLLRAA